jgi:hypothetical protein
MGFQDEIAQWRVQRKQLEAQQRVQEIKDEHELACHRRNEALANKDADEASMYDDEMMRLEHEHFELVGPPNPDPDGRYTKYMRKKATFLERYPEHGPAALDEAHRYITRPRNPHTQNPSLTGMGLRPGTPTYFKRMDDLLDLYAADLGLHHDATDDRLSATEAARISRVSPETYNRAAKAVAAAGKFSFQQTK